MIIQRYEVDMKALTKNVRFKVNQLIRQGCIHKVNNNTYKCSPIENYNSSTYTILIFKNNYMTCSCQYSRYNKTTPCSHIQAVKRYINAQLDEQQIGLFA